MTTNLSKVAPSTIIRGLTVKYEAQQKFAEAVRSLRAGRKIRKFAQLIGVSHPTILAWEQCGSIPKRENLERIAELRGQSLDEFLDFLESRTPSDPYQKALSIIQGAPKEQLFLLLRAIVDRLESL